MELRHLRYFIAIAEEESFRRAAEKLHVSQSPLSRQMQQLEGNLGAKLFEPVGRGVRFDPGAACFWNGRRRSLAREEAAAREASAATVSTSHRRSSPSAHASRGLDSTHFLLHPSRQYSMQGAHRCPA